MDKLVDYLLGLSGVAPYAVVFAILLACGLGVPIPEDITLAAGGLLAYYESANVWGMIVVSFLGVIIGDSIIFWLGSTFGRRLTKKGLFARLLPAERLDGVSQRLKRQGNKVIFAARFMPGLRAPVFFTCGTLHVPFRVFLFYDGLAALISVPTIVYLVFYFGDKIDWIVKMIKRFQFGIVGLILAIVFGIFLKWLWDRRKNAGVGGAP